MFFRVSQGSALIKNRSNSCILIYSWLLRDPEMKLRSMYPGYIDAVNAYFNKILPIFVPLQVSVITYGYYHTGIVLKEIEGYFKRRRRLFAFYIFSSLA